MGQQNMALIMPNILGYLILSVFAMVALCAFFRGAKLPESAFDEDPNLPIQGE